MKFSDFSQYLSKLEKTSSRNQMTKDLAKLFSNLGSNEIKKACYLLLGQLGPKFAVTEFNMGEKLMLKAISRAVSAPEEKVVKNYQDLGDLGEAVFKLKSKKEANGLSVAEVYDLLLEIGQQEGGGSVDRKLERMAKLLKNLDRVSAKYVARIPVDKLRLGFSDMTILDALSWLETKDKSLRPQIERAYNVCADIGQIAQVFKDLRLKGIKNIEAQVGVPIRPALSERLPSAQKVVEKLKRIAVEPKYDGFRCQLHIDKTKTIETGEGLFKKQQYLVRVFSRKLDDITHMFPEIVVQAQELPIKKAIFDGEAIGINLETGEFLPFQETVQRRRKHGVKDMAQKVPLKMFVFDLLFLNGQPIWRQDFEKRREKLEKVLKGKSGQIVVTEQNVVDNTDDLEELVTKYLNEGLEGAMCKKLDEPYQAGGRNYNWVKFKKSMQDGLVDTLDCVVMGYYYGKGKRNQFGIGAFLVGVKSGQRFKTVAKIGTGLSDEQWREMKKKADKLKTKVANGRFQVPKDLKPDVWIQPKLVVEIQADEITQSPLHSAGLALRFPRLVKFRKDKEVEQATTLKEVKKLYKMQ